MPTKSEPHPEPTEFQKFAALTKLVMSTPKAEIDRRAEAERKQREREKRRKIA